jgi:WD40 repeat protein
MAVAEVHPSVEELAAFTLGNLAEEAQASIEAHLVACTFCQERAAVALGAPLLELLRSAHARTSRGADTFVEAAAQVQTPGSLATVAMTDALAPAVAPSTPAESDRPEVPDPLPPELARHERYRVVRLLGAGGMGAVYEAEHRVMQRLVALKVIKRAYTANAAALERFRREVRAAARLSHPNIVTTHDAEDAGETHFLVMEYVEGTDLGRLVQQCGPLAVDRACEYVRQAALGLQYAFAQGMVHRDLKPHNLMLTRGGCVKILDFGLARFAGEAALGSVTGSGMVLGTVDYIAPEQADNAHEVDIRSDIYSLGCTLYHLLAGRPPFPSGTPLQKLMAHVNKKPQPLSELRDDLPEGLMHVLEGMMAKNPRHRYQTPADVARALEPFTVATAITRAPRSLPRARATDDDQTFLLEKTPVRGRRRRRFVIATAILLFLVAGLLGVAVYRIATDKGELVIETDNDDVEVVVSKRGEVVKIIDTKSGKHVTLNSGDYQLALKDGKEGLKLSPGKMTVKRGETVLATITRAGKRRPPRGPIAEKVGEVRRFEGHTGEVWHVALSADGSLALSVGLDQNGINARLWKVATGEQLYCFEGIHEDHLGVAFSPDSRTAFCSSGGWVRSWDVATGKERAPLRSQPDCGRIRSLAVSDDGRKLLAGGIHAAVLFDLQTGKELQRLDKSGWIHCAALSPDTTQILTGADDPTSGGTHLMRLWDAKTGQEIRRFAGHTNIIHDVAFSPDGKLCVSCGSYGDNTLRVFDRASGKELLSIPQPSSQERGAFLPDGQRFLTTCGDGVLYLWNVRNGQKLHSFKGHKGGIYAVAVSRDGRFALTGSTDKTMRLWRLPDPPPAKKNP